MARPCQEHAPSAAPGRDSGDGIVPPPVRQHGGGLGWGPADGSTTGTITGVVTNRGEIATPAVVNCTAGWATVVAQMAGVSLPIVTQPLQACVTEPLKPFLDKVIVSANLHVYINQTDRGELVIGAEVDPYQSYSMAGTLPTLEQMASYTLELFPQLHNVKVLRQWAGICDMTPDFSPIIGGVEGLAGFYPGRWLGHLRLQGRTDCRQVPGRADRHRQHPGPDRAVCPLPLPRRPARR